jgi:hypothetical protein
MFTPPIFNRPEDAPQVQAVARVDPAEYFLWNRPVFKAPPLDVRPPMADVADFVAGFARRGGADR